MTHKYLMPRLFADYACIQCGKSCKNWKVEVSPKDLAMLVPKVNEISDKNDDYGFEYWKDDQGKIERVYTKHSNCQCVFFQDSGLCLLHQNFGANVKPEVCISYPFYAIQTPDITFVNASLSCTAIQQLLQKQRPSNWLFPATQQVAAAVSVRGNFSHRRYVKVTPEKATKWKNFYRIIERLVNEEPKDWLHRLNSLWENLEKFPHAAILKEHIDELFALQSKPTTLSVDDHLQEIYTAIESQGFWDFQENDPIWALVEETRSKSNYLALYEEFFLPYVSEMSVLQRNFFAVHLYSSDYYFSHSVSQAIQIACLQWGIAVFLAIAAAKNEKRRVLLEDLLKAFYITERFFFHSKEPYNLNTTQSPQSLAYPR